MERLLKAKHIIALHLTMRGFGGIKKTNLKKLIMTDLYYQSWEWVEIQKEMHEEENASCIMDEFKEKEEFLSNKCSDCGKEAKEKYELFE